MSLFTKLFEAVHSWRRRRGGLRARKRADLAMEQLDHRQLLAVNFTGNAAIDFPATQVPGVVVIPSPPNNTIPIIPTVTNGVPDPGTLATVINETGFQINQLRVSYTPADDTLSVGIEGPPSGRNGAQQVIAGDSDNNGNSATVNPNVTAIDPGFMDPADMGGTKTYGIFLDLKNANAIDVVAGFAQGTPFDTGPKPYEVARPVSSALALPAFDPNNLLPQFTGNYFLVNDPNHPNFELQITHFSQLFQQTTGLALTSASQFSIGAFGTSAQDGGISDEFFPPQAVTVSAATPPPVAAPTIAVAKTTNGISAPLQPGPTVAVGSTVTWGYSVTNPGNEPLKNVTVIDDGGTPNDPATAFQPTFVGGDTNGNGLLDPGETWTFNATGTAMAGQYENQVIVSGVGVNSGTPVTASAVSHYFAPTPPMVCSPTIYVNPHESNHVNTAHPSSIRVNILGSSGFDPTTLIPSTVKFGDPATIATTGASPILNFESNVNHDGFPDETFVFNGLDVTLPPGITTAEIIGTTTSGQMIASSVTVFNRDFSFYTPAQISKQQATWLAFDKKNNISTANGAVPPPPVIPKAAQQRAASMAISDLYDPFKGKTVPKQVNAAAIGTAQPASTDAVAPVVSIKTKNGKAVKPSKAGPVTVKLAGSPAPKAASILQMIGGGA
jgi:hypothetical protein